MDDLSSSFLEVLTSNGKYYWVPIDRVDLIEFQPPGQWTDLVWREAHMVVRDGPDGNVHIPALYSGSHADSDDRIRLGRFTDWRGGNGSPVQGVGQRMFLIGEEARAILDLKTVSFTSAAQDTGDDTGPI